MSSSSMYDEDEDSTFVLRTIYTHTWSGHEAKNYVPVRKM